MVQVRNDAIQNQNRIGIYRSELLFWTKMMWFSTDVILIIKSSLIREYRTLLLANQNERIRDN